MQIKNRFTGEVLHDSGNADLSNADLRNANLSNADLRNADLSYADLSNADLSNADLRNANLSNADLSNANLSNADLSYANLIKANLIKANLRGANRLGEKLKSNPVFVYGLTWFITVTNEFLTIGCQRHSHSDWAGFDDARIESMHSGAIAFWRKWKTTLMLMCAEQSGL